MKKIILFFIAIFSFQMSFAQPANDEPCNAINIPVENLGCEPTNVYSYTGATYSAAAGAPYCINASVKDVWYKFNVPANGEAFIAIALNGTDYDIAVQVYKSTSCTALTTLTEAVEGFPCFYSNSNYGSLSRTFKNLAPGSIAYLRVYQTFPQNPYPPNGSVKICVSNTNQLADEPCNAGLLPVEDADPLGQICVPYKTFSWAGATLTPAIPNPSCGVINAAEIRDVWFKFKVPASGKFNINLLNAATGYSNTPFVTLYRATGCNGTFTEIYCNFIGNSLITEVPNSIIYGRLYVYCNCVTDFGTIKLCIAASNTVPSVNNFTKVGIGIDTPFAKLDVVGTGIFRDKVTAAADVEVRGNLIVKGNIVGKYGTTAIQGNTSIQGGSLNIDSLDIGNNVGNRIAMYGGLGNTAKYGFGIQNSLLQIFTDAPNSNIVFGSGNSYNFRERMKIANNGTDGMFLKGRLHLQNGSLPVDINQTPGVWLYKADNTNLLGFMGTQNNQNVGFFGGPTNGGWGFVYDAINSRVGIGTSTPTSSLNINGQVTIDQKNFGGYGGLLIKGNDQSNNYPNIAFSVRSNGNMPSDVVTAMIQGDPQNITAGIESSDITFYTAQSGFGSLSEKVRIKANGNVGIGNASALRPLSFPATLGEKILLYPGGIGEVGIGVYGNELRLHADNPGAKVSFGTQNNAGVYTENALAQRNGAFAFSVLGSLWVNGTTYASDERFKQNITPITSALQKLMQINGVEYEMKTKEFSNNHFTTGRQIGLLAQNVETVIPEAVNEKDGYKGVDYARLVPLLIEAVKEQNKKIELQQVEIDNLKRIIQNR
jgi:Chaperone of endosialidase